MIRRFAVVDPLPVWKVRKYTIEVDVDSDDELDDAITEAISDYDGLMEIDEEIIHELNKESAEWKEVL